MTALACGDFLNERFTLISPLASGATAQVWRVIDREQRREVVAKIVQPEAGAERAALLEREFEHLRRLSHPNIVCVLDLYRHKGFTFFTMDPAEGEDIGRLRGRSPLEIIQGVLPIAGALRHAHERGVIHRDLNISNIVCSARDVPLLVGFGIAAQAEVSGAGAPPLARGSPHSASPQQLAGLQPRPSDDVYALGVLLYELITGHPPLWPGITDERVRLEVPAPMRSSYPLPARLQSLVARMLEKSPAGRPPDMATIKNELTTVQADLEHGGASPREEGRAAIRLTPPPRVEPIRPVSPEFKPVSAGAGTHEGQLQQWPWPAILTLGLLGLAAIFVFFYLPRWATRLEQPVAGGSMSNEAAPDRDGPGSSAAPDSQAEPSDAAELSREARREKARQKHGAEEARDRARALREKLEQQGARVWGGKEYRDGTAELTLGDSHFAQGDYLTAEKVYVRSAAALDRLQGRSRRVLEQTLVDGGRALTSGDSTTATAAFSMALGIDPGNRSALTGLKRAGVLDDLIAQLDAGSQSERRRDWSTAERHYRKAVSLDPDSIAARQGLIKVQGKLADGTFSRLMSESLRALRQEDYPAARRALVEAESQRPGSPQVAEALAQVEEAEKLELISAHRRRAAEHEAAEEWRAAAGEYDAVLHLDTNIEFAQDGKRRCEARAHLSERIAYHLSHPDRLSSPDVYEEASNLLEDATEIDPAGSRHRELIEQLESLLRMAGTTIRVVLESDEQTEVTVYKIGRLGMFLRQEIELRPGTYTVVGTRRGYRDVRHQLVVVAGEEPPALLVRCGEEI